MLSYSFGWTEKQKNDFRHFGIEPTFDNRKLSSSSYSEMKHNKQFAESRIQNKIIKEVNV